MSKKEDRIIKEYLEESNNLGPFSGQSEVSKQFDKERTEANLELLALLTQYMLDNPYQRFGQALGTLMDLVTRFEEPTETLKRARTNIRALKGKDK